MEAIGKDKSIRLRVKRANERSPGEECKRPLLRPTPPPPPVALCPLADFPVLPAPTAGLIGAARFLTRQQLCSRRALEELIFRGRSVCSQESRERAAVPAQQHLSPANSQP